MKDLIVNNKSVNYEEIIEAIKENEGQFNIFECITKNTNEFVCTLVKKGSVYEVDNESQLMALKDIIDFYGYDYGIKSKYCKNAITCYKNDKEILVIRSIEKPKTVETFYKFSTKEELEKIINKVEKEGYERVAGLNIDFNWLKNNFKRNKYFVIDAYYNDINKKLEYQFSTIPVIKSFPQHKNAKFITI